jgi:20S proteasome alpha/beta subunit
MKNLSENGIAPTVRRQTCPPWKPKRKSAVTLILGIICKDAIVLAADSQTTKGTAKQLGANKISIVEFENGRAAVAESGSASLSNAAIHILQNLSKSRTIENEDAIAKVAEEAVREVLCGITKHLNPNSPDDERQALLFNQDNYFELMLAYYFGNKPCLYIVKSAWCIPVPATSFFLTSGIASDLANYILQEHTAPEMDKSLASVLAIKTVKDAIDYVEGCGMPIRVALVHKPYRKRPFKLVPVEGTIIGKRIYGDVTVEPSWIHLYKPERVEGIIKIISNVERKTKGSRNKKLHQALQCQSNAYSKKSEREWMDLCRKNPDMAVEIERRLMATAESFEILLDEN